MLFLLFNAAATAAIALVLYGLYLLWLFIVGKGGKK